MNNHTKQYQTLPTTRAKWKARDISGLSPVARMEYPAKAHHNLIADTATAELDDCLHGNYSWVKVDGTSSFRLHHPGVLVSNQLQLGFAAIFPGRWVFQA